MKRWLLVLPVLLVLAGLAYYYRSPASSPSPTESPAPGGDFETVAENLTVPWSIAFLPEGDLLVTERPGRLVRIGKDRVVVPIDGVEHTSEGGLLGLALHPDFPDNRWIYLYLTTRASGRITNQIERYAFDGTRVTDRKVIFSGIPGSSNHDGGRLAFGPDGLLYATTGDAGDANAAQDTGSLAGKILRLRDDGTIPADNPFGNAVYSLGHRNPQGLAWDDLGRLWATEHGRSGLASGYDEVNRIQKGLNYGWPIIEGDDGGRGLLSPVVHSGARTTWAPAGTAYWNGRLFFTGLRGEALYEAVIEGDRIGSVRAHFENELGRLRAVHLGPDGYIYFSTSNRDGRGKPDAQDDRIFRVRPESLSD